MSKPTVTVALSHDAVRMLAELAEKASAPGAQAATLAELYEAAQKAKREIPAG
jgi:hypothetical protein